MTILHQLQDAQFSHFNIYEIGTYVIKNGILQLKLAAFLLFPSGIHTTEKDLMAYLRIDGLLNSVKYSITKSCQKYQERNELLHPVESKPVR